MQCNYYYYCMSNHSNALHSCIGQNIKSLGVSYVRCPMSGQNVKNWCLLFIERSCDVNNGGCSEDARCRDTDRGPKCRCNKGYSGDGKTCTGKCSPSFSLIILIQKKTHKFVNRYCEGLSTPNGNNLLPETATLSQHLSKSPFLETICCRFRQLSCLVWTGLKCNRLSHGVATAWAGRVGQGPCKISVGRATMHLASSDLRSAKTHQFRFPLALPPTDPAIVTVLTQPSQLCLRAF